MKEKTVFSILIEYGYAAVSITKIKILFILVGIYKDPNLHR